MNDRHLAATEGMLLTNGDIYVTNVWLGDWDSPDNWREVTKEEATAMMAVDEHEIM